MAEETVNVTELPKAEALTNDDTLLLIRQTDEGQECYQIKGKQFNGKSAYDMAVEQGFTGTYEQWQAELKKTTEIANAVDTATTAASKANEAATKVEGWSEEFYTNDITIGSDEGTDVRTIINGCGLTMGHGADLDILEINGVSAFFGNIEIAFGQKKPNINWMYYPSIGYDCGIYIGADKISLTEDAEDEMITNITAEGITTPRLTITNGTSSQLLLANGDLAETITTDDINALFK